MGASRPPQLRAEPVKINGLGHDEIQDEIGDR
jgi:hypothetical protein